MRKKMNWTLVVLSIFILSLSGCTTKKKIIDDDFAVDSADAGLSQEDLTFDETAAPENTSSGHAQNSDLALETTDSVDSSTAQLEGDEFSEFDQDAAEVNAQGDQTAKVDSEKKNTDDLDKELNQLGEAPSETPPPAIVDVKPEEIKSETPPTEIVQTETPPPQPEVTQSASMVDSSDSQTKGVISKITNIQYKGNESGGTVVITADHPINYTTRLNSENNQIIVEADNVIISESLKRPLNTKDMSSSIGHIDIYQKKGSKTARFVIQLRPNSPEPLVQPEGNALLIVGSPASAVGSGSLATNLNQNTTSTEPVMAASSIENNQELNNELSAQGIMGSDDLEAFLTNNNKFYGKKISIEAPDLDVRDVLQFISEESGVNMVFDEKVEGKTTLKLRKVPWDQAFVTVLKSKKLSYRRQGSILRIALQEDLIKEDEAAVKLKEGKVSVEPLVVKNFSINYAKPSDLKGKIDEFMKSDNRAALQNRGKVTADDSTGTLIVTESKTNLKNISELIKILDTQPQQVMIEAKIIEASETFSKSIGGRIGLNRATGGDVPVPTLPSGFPSGRTAVTTGGTSGNFISTGIAAIPASGTGQGGSFVADMVFGTLGAFGNLDAQLALNEFENKIKIISSPRISVISNQSATIEQNGQIVQEPTVITSPTGGTTQTQNYAKIGVKLTVTPVVSNIGTVKLNLDIFRAAGGPNKTTTDRSAKTQVIVKNNETVVIGGIFTADVTKTKEGVPGLKDIPILGTLFKGEIDGNAKTELMMFVTPKIIPTLSHIFKADAKPESTSDSELEIK